MVRLDDETTEIRLTVTLKGADAFPAVHVPDADGGIRGSGADKWSTGTTVQASQGPDCVRMSLKGTM